MYVMWVIDYVRERAKVHKLEKDMKTWERKVEIAEVCSCPELLLQCLI